MAIYGHASIISSLHTHLPPASLFRGPFSVGKWTVAEHLRWHYGVDESDVLRVHNLDVSAAEAIYEFSLTPPANSEFKLVILDLFNSTRGAQVALTSVLDNPRHARIIVVSTPGQELPGILSRTVPYRFSYLRTEEVAQVLSEKLNFSEDRAQALAERSGGQVAMALRSANLEDSVRLVREALNALRTRDEDALSAVASRWTDAHTALLIQWCNEAITRQWMVFDHEDYVEGKALPLKILIALQPRVRPRLVVRSQLMRVLRGD